MTEEQEIKPPETLCEAKIIVEREFLGIAGIHGIGEKTSKNAVRVYASTKSSNLNVALEDIKSRCAPFSVDLVIEEKAVLAPPPKEPVADQMDEPEPE